RGLIRAEGGRAGGGRAAGRVPGVGHLELEAVGAVVVGVRLVGEDPVAARLGRQRAVGRPADDGVAQVGVGRLHVADQRAQVDLQAGAVLGRARVVVAGRRLVDDL